MAQRLALVALAARTRSRRSASTETGAIYRARYWDAVAGDELPEGLDLAVFDFAVNSGPVRAVAYLQAALGVAQDGIVGPVTLGAVDGRSGKGEHQVADPRALRPPSRLSQGLQDISRLRHRLDAPRRRHRERGRSPCARPAKPNPPKPKDNPIWIFSRATKPISSGSLMLVTAIAQMAGVDLPGFDGQSLDAASDAGAGRRLPAQGHQDRQRFDVADFVGHATDRSISGFHSYPIQMAAIILPP